MNSPFLVSTGSTDEWVVHEWIASFFSQGTYGNLPYISLEEGEIPFSPDRIVFHRAGMETCPTCLLEEGEIPSSPDRIVFHRAGMETCPTFL